MVHKYTGFSSNNYKFPIYYIMIRGQYLYWFFEMYWHIFCKETLFFINVSCVLIENIYYCESCIFSISIFSISFIFPFPAGKLNLGKRCMINFTIFLFGSFMHIQSASVSFHLEFACYFLQLYWLSGCSKLNDSFDAGSDSGWLPVASFLHTRLLPLVINVPFFLPRVLLFKLQRTGL